MQLKTYKCGNAYLRCIQNIYIQSQDDVIIYDIQKPLQYIDLRFNINLTVPVVFRDDIAVFNKSYAIRVFQDGTYYYVKMHLT